MGNPLKRLEKNVRREVKKAVRNVERAVGDTTEFVVDSVTDPANLVIPGAGVGAPTGKAFDWAEEGEEGPGDPGAPPSRGDAEVRAAADRERRRAAAARGRQSTILTGGRGLMEPAPVSRKQLLG